MALTGVTLPSPPPTRVYIGGKLYRLAPSPSISLPPLINTVKCILNWVVAGGTLAKNIFYAKSAPPFITSDPADLFSLANGIRGLFVGAGTISGSIATSASLQSVTCRDNAGTTASATSSGAAVPGTAGATAFPPQVTIALSWKIAESYRGGKPRWYLPGIPQSASFPAGTPKVEPVYATTLEAQAVTWMGAFNALVPHVGATVKLGTVSYYTGHTVRPTPQFREFIDVKVHERLDSQRRRSGRESAYPVTP